MQPLHSPWGMTQAVTVPITGKHWYRILMPLPLSVTESEFPRYPSDDQAVRLWPKLRERASQAVNSRGWYMGEVQRQRTHIAELQQELRRFSEEMSLTLQQKAELAHIIDGYAEVMGELEAAGNTLVETFDGANGWKGVFSMSALLEAVQAFINTWKLAMSKAALKKQLSEGKTHVNS